MRMPGQTVAEICTRYDKNWRDWLITPPTSPVAFSLAPPKAKQIAVDPAGVGQWIRTWKDWATQHPHTSLRTSTVRTDLGPQSVYTHLDLPTARDLARIDPHRAAHWDRATARWDKLTQLPGVTHARLRPKLALVMDLSEVDFQVLLAAVAWFTDNPRSGKSIRQVPVEGMHTKWLARHRSLVLACLNISDPSQPSASEETTNGTGSEIEQPALDPLGLRALPAHIDVILTDPENRQRVAGLRHLRAPIPSIAALPLNPRVVLVIENKESAYLVPDQAGVVVLHSLGNHLKVLSSLPWLEGARCLYWGDLDRAGITLLSRARLQRPDLESLLMDVETYQQYAHLAVPDPTRADPPQDTLTESERSALNALSDSSGHARLEQERLPAPYVLAALRSAVSEPGEPWDGSLS